MRSHGLDTTAEYLVKIIKTLVEKGSEFHEAGLSSVNILWDTFLPLGKYFRPSWRRMQIRGQSSWIATGSQYSLSFVV